MIPEANRARLSIGWRRFLRAAPCFAPLGFGICVFAGTPLPRPLHEGAIAYYNGACAHCHGPNGSAYEASFYSEFDLASLTQRIKDMADGPGQSPLSAEGLRAQVAYHEAILTHMPFVDWTAQDGESISGEVVRGAAVTAAINKKPISVDVKGFRWTVKLPRGTNVQSLSITAKLGDHVSVLRLATGSFWTPQKWPPKP